jgi:hypothetical protein
VRFQLRNTGARTLYLTGTTAQGITFQLIPQDAGADRPLPTPESSFCPLYCPAAGMPGEVDCGRAIPIVKEFPPGAVLHLGWSGEETVSVSRRCGAGPPRSCQLRRPSPAGRYRVTVCAYLAVKSGRRLPDGQDRLGDPVGVPICTHVAFAHPRTPVVDVSLR